MRGAILNDNYISYMYFLEEIVTIYNLIMCDGGLFNVMVLTGIHF